MKNKLNLKRKIKCIKQRRYKMLATWHRYLWKAIIVKPFHGILNMYFLSHLRGPFGFYNCHQLAFNIQHSPVPLLIKTEPTSSTIRPLTLTMILVWSRQQFLIGTSPGSKRHCNSDNNSSNNKSLVILQWARYKNQWHDLHWYNKKKLYKWQHSSKKQLNI